MSHAPVPLLQRPVERPQDVLPEVIETVTEVPLSEPVSDLAQRGDLGVAYIITRGDALAGGEFPELGPAARGVDRRGRWLGADEDDEVVPGNNAGRGEGDGQARCPVGDGGSAATVGDRHTSPPSVVSCAKRRDGESGPEDGVGPGDRERVACAL
ncbi:MAG: hypothetical protein IPN98_16675 [Propionivibrio sp.]|nr:hypothetical protein [Propionivibrio sp.]